MFAAPNQAHATLQLSWSANTNLLGSDASNTLLSGISAAAGGFSISGSAVGTNSGAFGPGVAGMDLSTITITSSGPSTLTLYLTQSGITSPTGLGTLSQSLTGQFLAGNGTVSMVSYANNSPNNLLYGNATGQTAPPPPTGGLTNVVTSAIGLGGASSTFFNASSPWSMTAIFTINFQTAGTVSLSSDGKTTFGVPAPAGILLACSGMPVFGLGAWLRRRKATVEA